WLVQVTVVPALTFSAAGENAKFLIATALPDTGAGGVLLLGGRMGILMLGMGEAPGAEPAAFPGPEAPGMPAVWCWPCPGVMAPAPVGEECDDWPHALRSPSAPAVATVATASPAAARDRRPGVRRCGYMLFVPH
ncbi:hypothetical protein ACIQ8G_35205, partial [Streptomyces sp. NPDC094154]